MVDDRRIHPEIHRTRKKIEALDKKMLKTLKARFDAVDRMGRNKAMMDYPVTNPDIEAKLFKRWKKTFKKAKVSNSFINELFDLIVDESKDQQAKYFDKN